MSVIFRDYAQVSTGSEPGHDRLCGRIDQSPDPLEVVRPTRVGVGHLASGPDAGPFQQPADILL